MEVFFFYIVFFYFVVRNADLVTMIISSFAKTRHLHFWAILYLFIRANELIITRLRFGLIWSILSINICWMEVPCEPLMRNHRILMMSADLPSQPLSSQTWSLFSVLSLENLLSLKALFAKYIISKSRISY